MQFHQELQVCNVITLSITFILIHPFFSATVYAATTGRVVEAAYPVSWGSAYGRAAIVETEGRRYLYAHLNGLNVRQGQHVKAGERIGTSGATGHVTGPHLHFEMRLRPYRYAVDARKPIF